MVGPMSDASVLLTGRGRLLLPEPYDGPMPWAILLRAGRIAWERRPANRTGILLTALGFAVLVRTW